MNDDEKEVNLQHLPRKSKIRHFRIEIDQKIARILDIIVLRQFGIFIIPKNNIIFSEPLFSNMVSLKYISPIVAAAAGAKHAGSCICTIHHASSSIIHVDDPLSARMIHRPCGSGGLKNTQE